jgi:hypothetical protein
MHCLNRVVSIFLEISQQASKPNLINQKVSNCLRTSYCRHQVDSWLCQTQRFQFYIATPLENKPAVLGENLLNMTSVFGVVKI